MTGTAKDPNAVDYERLLQSPPTWDATVAELRRAVSYPTIEDGGRMAAVIALSAVVDFLQHHEPVASERLHLPLARLRNALVDLRWGTVAKMLRPVPYGSRLPAGSDKALLRAAGVALSDVFKLAGKERPEADLMAARALSRRGYRNPDNGERITKKNMLSWRKHTRAQRDDPGNAKDLHAKFMSLFEAYDDPDAFVTKLLDKYLVARLPTK